MCDRERTDEQIDHEIAGLEGRLTALKAERQKRHDRERIRADILSANDRLENSTLSNLPLVTRNSIRMLITAFANGELVWKD